MGRRKKGTPPELTLALDFGGSMTKVLASTQTGEVYSLCMEPEVIQVDGTSIEQYQRTKLGEAAPKDRAWVGVGEDYYAVGYLAGSRFLGNAGLSELKHERALYKTLAAVWVLAEQLELGRRLRVAIACLLPPGEYKDQVRFQQLLEEALANYQTPGGTMQVKLEAFNCKPEGGGIYMMYAKNQGEALKEQVCAVVMVGYRNGSVLVSQRGEVGQFQTSEFGFIKLVNGVVERTSGQKAERLAKAISLAGEEITPRPLLPLARSTKPKERRNEVEMIREAIREARSEYARQLTGWLRETLPKDLDEVVLCGGTADYLRTELKQHFEFSRISWHADVRLPEVLDPKGMGSRLVDVYCLFVYFQKLLLPQTQTVLKEAISSTLAEV